MSDKIKVAEALEALSDLIKMAMNKFHDSRGWNIEVINDRADTIRSTLASLKETPCEASLRPDKAVEPETIAVFEFMDEKINVTRENSAFVRVVKDFIESTLNPKSESE